LSSYTQTLHSRDVGFQERTLHVEQMENQLRKLFGIVENVLTCRSGHIKGTAARKFFAYNDPDCRNLIKNIFNTSLFLKKKTLKIIVIKKIALNRPETREGFSLPRYFFSSNHEVC